MGGQPPSCEAGFSTKRFTAGCQLSYLSGRNETAIYNGIALVTNRSKPWSQLRKTRVLIFASFCIKVHTVRRVSVRNCRQTWFLQRCKYQRFNNIRNSFAMIRIPSLAPFFTYEAPKTRDFCYGFAIRFSGLPLFLITSDLPASGRPNVAQCLLNSVVHPPQFQVLDIFA